MKIIVFFEKNKKKKILEFKNKNIKVKDVLKKLNLINENYVVVKNNEVIIDEEKLKNNDKIKLFNVISGG